MRASLADHQERGCHGEKVPPGPGQPGEQDEQQLVGGLEVALAA